MSDQKNKGFKTALMKPIKPKISALNTNKQGKLTHYIKVGQDKINT